MSFGIFVVLCIYRENGFLFEFHCRKHKAVALCEYLHSYLSQSLDYVHLFLTYTIFCAQVATKQGIVAQYYYGVHLWCVGSRENSGVYRSVSVTSDFHEVHRTR